MQYDAGGLFQARGLVRFYRFTPPLDGPVYKIQYVKIVAPCTESVLKIFVHGYWTAILRICTQLKFISNCQCTGSVEKPAEKLAKKHFHIGHHLERDHENDEIGFGN